MPGATSETTPFNRAENRGPPIQQQIKRTAKRSQVLHIQEVLLEGIDDPEEPLSSKAQAARAYDVLEDRLRELSGKPKLAPIKAEPKRKRSAPVMPVSEGPANPPPDATA